MSNAALTSSQSQGLEALLPWGVEQRLAAWLNPLKIPLIVLVMVLGSAIELQLNANTLDIWYTSSWQAGPQCYLHRVPRGLSRRASFTREVQLREAAFAQAVVQPVNATMSALGLYGYHWHGNASLGFRTHERRCGLVEVRPEPPPPAGSLQGPPGAAAETNDTSRDPSPEATARPRGHCAVNDGELQYEHLGDGAQWVIRGGRGTLNTIFGVHVPFCFIWGLYKLVFLPIYWIDYLSNRLAGDRVEPTFKLIAAPHFQIGTAFMNGVVMVGKTFMYSLMPNNLIIPLLTLVFDEECPNFVRYSWSYYTSAFIYLWAILNMVEAFVLFVVGKTVLRGRCIGSWSYRAYKAWWLLSFPISVVVWAVDSMNLMEWDIRRCFSLMISLTIDLKFDYVWDVTVDICRICATTVWMIDSMQFWILVITVLCPKLVERLGDRLTGASCCKYSRVATAPPDSSR